jgi:predicted GNAT family N-acyltransferase
LIVAALEAKAKEKGLLKAKLHGQTHARRFYEKAGYTEITGDIFMEEGIPHIAMGKNL